VDILSTDFVDKSEWIKRVGETLGVLHNFTELSTFFDRLSTSFAFFHAKSRIKSLNCSGLSLFVHSTVSAAAKLAETVEWTNYLLCG
jgi:hypothetical protein